MKIVMTLCAVMLACSAFGQTNAKPTFIKGNMSIRFDSRVPDNSGAKPRPNTTDKYSMNLLMSDSIALKGDVESTPLIQGVVYGITQPASLKYNLTFDVVNPANTAQRKPDVGRLYGIVPITPEGLYDYTKGSVKITVYATGKADELNSPFGGTIQGKRLIKGGGGISGSLSRAAMSFTKSVGGKTVAVVVKKYDTMVFNNHTLASGPVEIYPVATVSGQMVYDYDRYVWHFKDFSISYKQGRTTANDSISGNIRWVEKPKQGALREGQYEFDVRVNEPPATESDAFSAPTDEAAFFQTDTSIPSLTGTMKYKDSIPQESVMASEVAVDLTGNQLNKQQCVNLMKLLFVTCILPMNSE